MTTAKHAARAELLSVRKSMPAPEREAADRATWTALHDFLSGSVSAGGTVAAYRPFGAEPGATLDPELPERLARTWRVLLPVTLPDNDLDWTCLEPDGHHADTEAELAWGGRALSGPAGTETVAARCGVEAIGRARAVVVPGLAVSHDGIRLGRGGGSYDRALARLALGVPVVALLRDGEYGVAVPAEAHDRPVTGVITPKAGFVTAG